MMNQTMGIPYRAQAVLLFGASVLGGDLDNILIT